MSSQASKGTRTKDPIALSAQWSGPGSLYVTIPLLERKEDDPATLWGPLTELNLVPWGAWTNVPRC